MQWSFTLLPHLLFFMILSPPYTYLVKNYGVFPSYCFLTAFSQLLLFRWVTRLDSATLVSPFIPDAFQTPIYFATFGSLQLGPPFSIPHTLLALLTFIYFFSTIWQAAHSILTILSFLQSALFLLNSRCSFFHMFFLSYHILLPSSLSCFLSPPFGSSFSSSTCVGLRYGFPLLFPFFSLFSSPPFGSYIMTPSYTLLFLLSSLVTLSSFFPSLPFFSSRYSTQHSLFSFLLLYLLPWFGLLSSLFLFFFGSSLLHALTPSSLVCCF